MPQQINLCTPILLAPRRHFQAQSMGWALLVFLVFGAVLLAYWVHSLNAASQGLTQAYEARANELTQLQTALAQRKNSGAGDAGARAQQLQALKATLTERERVLQVLKQGLYAPGTGYSARLMLIAQSIPAPIWITRARIHEAHLEVSGFTLEPAALNDWVTRLDASPLLQGQRLMQVSVAGASEAVTQSVARPVWAFSLVSAQASAAAKTEGQP